MLDKAALTGGTINALPQEDVEIPGKGSVRVRALTRAEMLSLGDNLSVLEIERKMISMAMIDPVLTEAEVKAWQDSSPVNEMTTVVRKINALGGVGQGVDKTAYKSL